MNNQQLQPTAMIIAGSDSSAGAGIQADLKVFTHFHTYAATVITAITAQNTTGVYHSTVLSPEVVKQQLDITASDLNITHVKIGMLGDASIIKVVADFLQNHPHYQVVLDPVMLAKSQTALLATNSINQLIDQLFARVYLITPNIQEAEALTGLSINTIDDVRQACIQLNSMGVQNVLIKGGHLDGIPIDTLYANQKFYYFKGKRYNDKFTHGTGCSLASAICANLMKGYSLPKAIKISKIYVAHGIKHGITIGYGYNPIKHW